MQIPSFLWITDPWNTLFHSKDTTLRLMQEAIIMGIPTFWTASDLVFSNQYPDQLMVADFSKGIPDHPEKFLLQPHSPSRFQQIHYRIDPPVDENYRNLIHALFRHGVKPNQILNPPDLLIHQSEKIPPDQLMKFSPKMLVVENKADIFLAQKLFATDQEIVSKPLHLAQSIGVKKHLRPATEDEWESLLKELTDDFQNKILIEEYLKKIESGEVRLWFAGEQLIGALKKHPKKGDFRVLIDEGSLIEAHQLSQTEMAIAHEIGSVLKKLGILMAAVDLIDEKICDFNITSPGLLMQLEEVHGGKNFTKEVLAQALKFRASQDHE